MRTDLTRAERLLRHDDPAVRVRESLEGPDILLERKTFRGKIGSLGPDGIEWAPDGGYRREHGHVLVATIGRKNFSPVALRDALRRADTWRKWDAQARPLWRRVEDAESYTTAERKAKRYLDLRHKAAGTFDRFAWQSKSRVAF